MAGSIHPTPFLEVSKSVLLTRCLGRKKWHRCSQAGQGRRSELKLASRPPPPPPCHGRFWGEVRASIHVVLRIPAPSQPNAHDNHPSSGLTPNIWQSEMFQILNAVALLRLPEFHFVSLFRGTLGILYVCLPPPPQSHYKKLTLSVFLLIFFPLMLHAF